VKSNQRAAARGTTTGGAAEAVVAEKDRSVLQSLRIDIPEEERAVIFSLHSELLVEIAIIDLAGLADTQGVAAHEVRLQRWSRMVLTCGISRNRSTK
jgi:hypothetical protein